MSRNQIVSMKDYGNASIELLKIVAIIVVMLLAFMGVQKSWDSIVNVFGKSKVELVEDNKKLSKKIESLIKDDIIKVIAKEGENNLSAIDDKNIKKQVVSETKVDTSFKQIKEKAQDKIVKRDDPKLIEEEIRFIQSSVAVYEMVSEALCLADPSQCEEV